MRSLVYLTLKWYVAYCILLDHRMALLLALQLFFDDERRNNEVESLGEPSSSAVAEE